MSNDNIIYFDKYKKSKEKKGKTIQITMIESLKSTLIDILSTEIEDLKITMADSLSYNNPTSYNFAKNTIHTLVKCIKKIKNELDFSYKEIHLMLGIVELRKEHLSLFLTFEDNIDNVDENHKLYSNLKDIYFILDYTLKEYIETEIKNNGY